MASIKLYRHINYLVRLNMLTDRPTLSPKYVCTLLTHRRTTWQRQTIKCYWDFGK